jgi:hypothetical protein
MEIVTLDKPGPKVGPVADTRRKMAKVRALAKTMPGYVFESRKISITILHENVALQQSSVQ